MLFFMELISLQHNKSTFKTYRYALYIVDYHYYGAVFRRFM
jgi:hypothetical protein